MYGLNVLIFLVFIAGTFAKFQNNPNPCAYGDTTCIKNMINFLFNQKFNGYSLLNLVKMDPLKIAAIDIKQGKESPVNIDLQFRDSDLLGLKLIETTKIKGFGKNLTERHEVHAFIPTISLIGDYTISGKVLILPIQGSGKSNITLVNTDVVLYLTGLRLDQPDGTHMKIKHIRMSFVPKQAYFNFENLFNGNKQLGDTMNRFLNENWADIYHEVQLSLESAISQVFESVINNVFQKYPYDKFFV